MSFAKIIVNENFSENTINQLENMERNKNV